MKIEIKKGKLMFTKNDNTLNFCLIKLIAHSAVFCNTFAA